MRTGMPRDLSTFIMAEAGMDGASNEANHGNPRSHSGHGYSLKRTDFLLG